MHEIQDISKIAIIGAGLMGRVLAMNLYQNAYTNITMFDKDSIEGNISPAYIAAGMLCADSESIMGGNIIYQLGKDSVKLWSKYLQKLQHIDTYDAKNLLNAQGSLLLSSNEFCDDVAHYINKIKFNTQNHTLSNQNIQFLPKNDLLDIEPELHNFSSAYLLKHEACLNAKAVMQSMAKYLLKKITWYQNCDVTQINNDTTISYINKNTQNIDTKLNKEFDLIIDCRGLGAKDKYNNLRAVRGEIIHVYAPEVNINRPLRLFNPRHNIYISPYAKNCYAIGATEIEAQDFSEISVHSTLELLSIAYTIHSGFAEARILHASTNCRPTLPNNLPLIKVNKTKNIISVNGLYRHGFLLAPSLSEEILKYLKINQKNIPEIWQED
jgi:glycine oxidase